MNSKTEWILGILCSDECENNTNTLTHSQYVSTCCKENDLSAGGLTRMKDVYKCTMVVFFLLFLQLVLTITPPRDG